MPHIAATRIHNIALVGHSGTGKTTLAEALLHCSGAIARRGRVEDGSTVLGAEPEDLAHHSSLSLGVASFEHAGHRITLLDTPGLPDFVADAEIALGVADLGVFLVSAVEGVEVQTEVLWRAAERLGLPRMIFVNKLDAERADYERVLEQCRELFGSGVAPLELPLYDDGHFCGIADLLADEAVLYHDGVATTGPIPDDVAELEHRVRDSLVEGIVVADDALMERYLDGDTPSADELEATLSLGIQAGAVFPLLCGAAAGEVAIERLANFFCEIAEHRPVEARAGEETVVLEPDPGADVCLRVFKQLVDPFVGRIALMQVCSGTLRPDTVLVNTRTRAEERLHVLQHLLGRTASPASEAPAGDLVAVPKLSDTRVGDTLAVRGRPVAVTPIPHSTPTFAIAIRPKSAGDDDRLMTALHRLQDEDVALELRRDDETHQTLISGIGETHLHVALERLGRKFGVEVERGELTVPYRETITRPSAGEGRFKKQTGGHGQFGVAQVRIEPLERGAGFAFVDEVVGGAIPRQFIPAVEKGVRRAMSQGGAFGFPVVDVAVTVFDGKFHPVDSSEASFEQAGALAFAEALAGADPVPLEPISRLAVTVPARYLGDVLGDITARRARVLSSEVDDRGEQTIVALVPTAEIGRYAVDLRALTGGHGSFSVEHDHYDALPAHLLDRLGNQRTLVS